LEIQNMDWDRHTHLTRLSGENLYAMNKSLIEATVIVWDHFLYIIKCLKYTVRLRKMSMLVNWIANDHEEIKIRFKHSRLLSPLSNIQGCECLIEETAALNV
jgi:hypothetical protein